VDFMQAGFPEDAASFMERAYKVDNTDWRMTLEFGQAALKATLPEAATHWFRRTLTGRTDEEQVWKAVGLAYAEAAKP
jgi:Flp pilus assembly protein TadD